MMEMPRRSELQQRLVLFAALFTLADAAFFFTLLSFGSQDYAKSTVGLSVSMILLLFSAPITLYVCLNHLARRRVTEEV